MPTGFRMSIMSEKTKRHFMEEFLGIAINAIDNPKDLNAQEAVFAFAAYAFPCMSVLVSLAYHMHRAVAEEDFESLEPISRAQSLAFLEFEKIVGNWSKLKGDLNSRPNDECFH